MANTSATSNLAASIASWRSGSAGFYKFLEDVEPRVRSSTGGFIPFQPGPREAAEITKALDGADISVAVFCWPRRHGKSVFLFFCINQAAKVGGRMIPNDATGWLAALAKLCTFVGADPSSRVTAGVTVQDIAQQTLTTPPVNQKVAEATGTPLAPPQEPVT